MKAKCISSPEINLSSPQGPASSFLWISALEFVDSVQLLVKLVKTVLSFTHTQTSPPPSSFLQQYLSMSEKGN